MSRDTWFILAVLTFLALQEPGFLGILFLVGLLLFSRNLLGGNTNQQRQQSRRQGRYRVEVPASTRRREARPIREENFEEPVHVQEHSIYPHALTAVQAAGKDPDDLAVLPVDLGFLVFKDENRMIYKEAAIPDDIDYIQPYVELRIPKAANGKISFRIYNASNELIYAYSDQFTLERGRNLVTPSTRLPIHDQHDFSRFWRFEVAVGKTTIASHTFDWYDNEDHDDPLVSADGELSSEIRAMLEESRLQQMSLDELLSYQESEEQQRR